MGMVEVAIQLVWGLWVLFFVIVFFILWGCITFLITFFLYLYTTVVVFYYSRDILLGLACGDC